MAHAKDHKEHDIPSGRYMIMLRDAAGPSEKV